MRWDVTVANLRLADGARGIKIPPAETRGERDAGGRKPTIYAAFFFLSAHRFFMASPIRLRAAADRCLFRPSGLLDAAGLPSLRRLL